MKKDIEWLKEEIEEDIKSWGGGNPDYFRGVSDAYENVKDWLNQLDEPEVLSQEWISDNAVVGQYPDGMGYVVPTYKLQNLLVPKQEELEAKIQELIEVYKQEEDAYSNPENGWIGGFIEDLKNLVEEEQKYYVADNSNRKLLYKYKQNVITELEASLLPATELVESELTEQEIKDYDERFWSFAVKIEELEEC